MKLYGVPLSVHTRKVIIAARMKQIPFDLQVVIPIIPDSPPPDWLHISPTGLIPAIDDSGFRLADSTAIIQYLEQIHPAPPLVPNSAKARGQTLFLDAWAGSALFRDIMHPIFHNQVVNPGMRNLPPDQDALAAALGTAAPRAFGYLESLAPGDHLLGGGITLADLAVVSNLVQFHYLGHRIGPDFPKLSAYFQRHLASPLLRAVLADETSFADQMGLDRSFLG